MTCRLELAFSGKVWPRSCPECGISGTCKQGFKQVKLTPEEATTQGRSYVILNHIGAPDKPYANGTVPAAVLIATGRLAAARVTDYIGAPQPVPDLTKMPPEAFAAYIKEQERRDSGLPVKPSDPLSNSNLTRIQIARLSDLIEKINDASSMSEREIREHVSEIETIFDTQD